MDIQNLLMTGNHNQKASLADRYFNNGDVEIMLLDLNKRLKFQRDYYKERDDLIQQIKISRNEPYRIKDIERLIAERDNIQKKEEDYISKLDEIQLLYDKKLQIESQGVLAPDGLQGKLKDLVAIAKHEQTSIKEHKREFQIRFAQKRKDGSTISKSQSSFRNTANQILNPNIPMSTPEIDARQERINKLKNNQRSILLNDFIPEETGAINERNAKNGVERMIRSQLDKTLSEKDQENRLQNLTALRSSMEVLNTMNGNNFNRPTIDISGLNSSNIQKLNGSYPEQAKNQMEEIEQILDRLPVATNSGQEAKDSIDRALKKKQLQELFNKKTGIIDRVYKNNKQVPTGLIPIKSQSNNNNLNSSTRSFPKQIATDNVAGFWNDVAAKSAVKMAADKLNRMIKEHARTIEDVRLALMIGNDQVKDRSNEEASLRKLAQQELEMTQALAMLPFSKDMYQYKMNQLNELANARKNLEKVLIENRLANRMGPTSTDPNFDNRKKRVRTELRRALGEIEEVTGEYDIKLGFDLHFDFILDIPVQHQSSQVSFGLFNNGQTVDPTKLTSSHTVEGEEQGNIRSLYGEKHTVLNIPADPETLLFFEIQFMNKLDQIHQNTSYGWTAVHLFTDMKSLVRGRYKLPIYPPPIDISLNKNKIEFLRPLSRCYLHIRINHPNEANEETDFNFYDELSSIGYSVPYYHDYRSADGKQQELEEGQERDKRLELEEEKRRLEQIVSNQRDKIQELMELDDDRYNQMFFGQRAILSRLNQDPFDVLEPPKPTTPKEKEEIKDQVVENGDLIAENENNKDEKKGELTLKDEYFLEPPPFKGLKLEIIKIVKIKEEDPLSFNIEILYDTEILEDDEEEQIDFNSDEYIPKFKKKKKETDVKMGDIFKIPFHFQGLFDILKRKNIKNKTCYIKFTMNRGDKTVGWYIFDLMKKYKVQKGKFKSKLYPLPIKEVPFDEKAYKKLKPLEKGKQLFEFKIGWEEYDRNNISKFREGGKKPKPKKEKKKKEKKEKNKKEKKVKEKKTKEDKKKKKTTKKTKITKKKKLSKLKNKKKKRPEKKKRVKLRLDKPFLKSKANVHSKDIFDNKGYDIIVDQLRFIPSNCTVVKMVVRVVDENFKDLVDPQAGISKLDSVYQSPEFLFRMEIRGDLEYEKTSHLFITWLTVDYYNIVQPCIIGYSFFPLFLNLKDDGEEASEDDGDVTLHDGAYQIPVYCEEFPAGEKIYIDKIKELDRIPVATCLIRIQPPVLDDDGEPLGENDVEQEDWADKGIYTPFESYRHRAYCTKYIPDVSEYEETMYENRGKDTFTFETIAQRTKLLMRADQEDFEEDPERDKEETNQILLNYIDKKCYIDDTIEFLDLKYLEPYFSAYGFSFAVDGICQPKINSGNFVVVAIINPPGGFYNEQPDSELVNLAFNLDWDSKQELIRFSDGWFDTRGVGLERNSHIIFAIKEIIVKKNNTVKITDFGFTVLPLLAENTFTYTGTFQLPIFKNDMTKDTVNELATDDPYQVLLELATKKGRNGKPMVEPHEKTSLIVRLKDNFFEHLFERQFDVTRMDYSFLPQAYLKKFRYDRSRAEKILQSTKTMREFLPEGVKDDEFNEYRRIAFNDAYQLNLGGDEVDEDDPFANVAQYG